MRPRGTDSLVRVSVSRLDVLIRSSFAHARPQSLPQSRLARSSLHRPDHSAEVMATGTPHGVTGPGKSGLLERREPTLARDEPTSIPPPPEKPKKRIEGPRRPPVVGMGHAFAQHNDASLTQHLEYMAERDDLVL